MLRSPSFAQSFPISAGRIPRPQASSLPPTPSSPPIQNVAGGSKAPERAHEEALGEADGRQQGRQQGHQEVSPRAPNHELRTLKPYFWRKASTSRAARTAAFTSSDPSAFCSASIAGSTNAARRSHAERWTCGAAPPCIRQTVPPGIGTRLQRSPDCFERAVQRRSMGFWLSMGWCRLFTASVRKVVR